MKLYSPVGEQDFMWFVIYDDGSYLTEIDYKTKKYNTYQSVDFSRVVEYGILGIGVKLSVELATRKFSIMGKALEVEYLVDGQNILDGLEKTYMTNPYKLAQAVTIMSANVKLKEYYDVNSNILSYEYGIGLDGEKYKAQITCHLVRGEKMYVNFRVLSKESDVDGIVRFKVNGTTNKEYVAPLTADNWGELNWTFEG